MYSQQEKFVWSLEFHEEQTCKDDVTYLKSSLLRLIGLGRDFQSCLNLLEYCDRKLNTKMRPNDFLPWKATALRDGAIILEQYSQAMKFAVNGKGWQYQIDRKALSKARKQFEKYFPNISDIRQTIVHQSEMDRQRNPEHFITTPQKFGSMTVGMLGMEIYVPSNYIWNGYYASYRGKLVGYLLNADAAQTLNEITAAVLQAFMLVDQKNS